MSLTNKTFNGVIWTLMQNSGIQIVGFIVSIFLARILAPAEFGIIGMISIFIAVGNVLVNSGMSNSLIRTKNITELDYSTVFTFNLIISILIYFLIFISADKIANYFLTPVLASIIKVYCLTFIINALSVVQLTKLSKDFKFKIQMKISIISVLCSGVLGIYLAYHDFGVWSLVYMYLSQSILSTILLWIYSGWIPDFNFSTEKLKSHFSFGYKLMISGLLDCIFNNSYLVIIGKVFSPTQLGYYTRADSFKQLTSVNYATAISKVTFPILASLNDNTYRLKNALRNSIQMTVFVTAPIILFCGLMAKPIFKLLFTETWLPAVPYFQILSIVGLLYPLHSFNLNILQIKGRTDLFLRLEVYKKVLVAISLLFIFPFGIYGLLWGQVFVSILGFFINTIYSKSLINYKTTEQIKDIFPLYLLCFLTVALTYYFNSFFLKEYSDIVRLLACLMLFFSIYIISSLLIKLQPALNLKSIIKERIRPHYE